MNKSFFITATNTDVGKTFVTSSLLKAFLENSFKAIAIKPVQSGCQNGVAPDVEEYKKVNPKNNHEPLYKLDYPSSPHYAAKKENISINLDEIYNYTLKFTKNYDVSLIEGAGGIFVPLNENETIFDLMKILNLPVILVSKNELGALNQILLNIEILENSGLEVACIVLNFSDLKSQIELSNLEYLKSKFDGFIINLENDLTYEKASHKFYDFVKNYNFKQNSIDLEFDKKHLFHPYTSSIKPLKSYGVKYAKGNKIYTKNGALIDGMSSWWCAYQGYNNQILNKAAISQLNKFSHVMFGGLTHEPAINLGKKLLEILPKEMEQIFYCDSGSVSVEVSLKMAIQYQQNSNPKKTKFLTILGGYHGDTIGAMSVCDPKNGMHFLFNGVLATQIFAPRPTCKFGEKFDENSLNEIKEIISKNKDEIAAIIVEPIVQGAGGMWFYHENYLKFLRQICDEIGALLIFDEIATGFGRTGEMFACELAEVTPDIMCIGKALTAGYMSFAATVLKKEVANKICQNDRVFMHGPTFMANPLACSVALKNLEILANLNFKDKVKKIEKFMAKNLEKCYEFDIVNDVRVLGAIGVVEIKQNVNLEKIQEFFVQKGVWIRPFGKNIYIMPPFTITDDELKTLCDAVYEAIKSKSY